MDLRFLFLAFADIQESNDGTDDPAILDLRIGVIFHADGASVGAPENLILHMHFLSPLERKNNLAIVFGQG